MRDYITFCLDHSLPLDPTPETLSHYIAYTFIFIAYTSIFIASAPKYLSGAHHFLCQIYPNFDTNRAHPFVQATIVGSKKIQADPIRQKLPVRLAHLTSFQQVALISQKYNDLLFITLLSCCFYGCHRSGELILKNLKDKFNWHKIIKRHSLVFNSNRLSYRLPYHKTNCFYHVTDILFSSQRIADPVELLKTFVACRDRLHGAHAASFICENGSLPNQIWFDKKFFTLLDCHFGGHSLWQHYLFC